MEKPLASQPNVHLNPFAFPSETDIRFLLLVLAIAGSTMILVEGVLGIFIQNTLITFPVALIVTISLFVMARNQARQSAIKTIKTNHWQTFPPQKADPFQFASLQQMDRYIQQIVANVPELASEKIQFIWDETSNASLLPTGMAFGFGKQQYVCLRKGLHDAFIQFPQSPTFQSVLMHELGHIANGDVTKTIFATSLGRCFFPIAITCVILFACYTLWAVGDRLVKSITLDSALPGIREIINTNIKLLILLLLVEVARSSILRVREYYADARARNWLGSSTSLTELFSKHLGRSSPKASKSNCKNQQNRLPVWEILRRWFRVQLAPLHPNHQQRIAKLKNPRYLFSPSYEIASLAGLLSGIALNANMIIFSILPEITKLNIRLNQSVKMADEPTLLILLTIILFFVLSLVFFAVMLAVFVIFGLIPIVGTVGLQIQQAAFCDRAQPNQPQLLTLQKLALLSLVLGISFVLGCLLSPFSHALSMRSTAGAIPWLGVLGLILGWTSVFFIWTISVTHLAKNLYCYHIESTIPHQKRRWLTRFSAILLFPLFLSMCGIQILFGAKAVDSELFSSSALIIGCLIAVIIALILYGVIWIIGRIVGTVRGWFQKPRCPHCKSLINNQASLLQTCPECHYPIADWTRLPAPVSFPMPPPPTSVMDAPPPL